MTAHITDEQIDVGRGRITEQLRSAIKSRALAAGISLNEVERRTRWSTGTLSRVMRSNMTLASLERIATALGCAPWELMRDAALDGADALDRVRQAGRGCHHALDTRQTRQQRVEHANALIRVIASHGRRFFYSAQHRRYARIELDQRGRVWWVDDYAGTRIYTHRTPFGNRWRGFSHGGTLRNLAELMRDYITAGTPIHRGYIAPAMSYGDLWGYGEAAAAAVQAGAFELPIMAAPKDGA